MLTPNSDPILMRLRRFPGFAVSALALAFLPAISHAQQPAANPPALVLHTQAHNVVLPVTVRDKRGVLVPDMQKTDLTLTEDGRAQVIQSFTKESSLPFQLGLLVDTSSSMMGVMESERKALDAFVDQMLPASAGASKDEAFLIHFDREVELLRDFTGLRDKLHTEIEAMGPTSKTQDTRQGPETMGDDRQRPSGSQGGSQLYDAIFLASDELMKSKDGRKALVVFSDGVDRGSKESMNDALDAAERANVTVYTVYLRGDQGRESPFPGSGRKGGMGGIWPGGGGGYPGGPGGGYPGGGGAPSGGGREPKSDGKRVLEQIAARTGGRYFDTRRKEDLVKIYGIIGDELHGQYLLTYTPDKVDTDGGFHKIVLKTDKKDVTVVTREGYFAPGGNSK